MRSIFVLFIWICVLVLIAVLAPTLVIEHYRPIPAANQSVYSTIKQLPMDEFRNMSNKVFLEQFLDQLKQGNDSLAAMIRFQEIRTANLTQVLQFYNSHIFEKCTQLNRLVAFSNRNSAPRIPMRQRRQF